MINTAELRVKYADNGEVMSLIDVVEHWIKSASELSIKIEQLECAAEQMRRG
jgi:hypothetical protein